MTLPFLTAPPDLAGIALGHTDLVIFDCDGVLIDSEPLASATMAEVLGRYDVRLSADEVRLAFTGAAASETRDRLRQDYGLTEVGEFYEAWHELLFATFASHLAPMPGIETVVRAISCPVCVGSNSGVRRLELSLGVLPLAGAFGADIFSAEMVAKPKPAPDLLLYAAARMGARPARSVMIDDSTHGIAAARAAGMPGIGFVDPADPRPGRVAALEAAGAFTVVTGAAGLPAALLAVDAAFAEAT